MVTDEIGSDGSYTILRDSQGRSVIGVGVPPAPNQNLGLSNGTPCYDTTTRSWREYGGVTWGISLPPLLKATLTITPAQIGAIFTTPLAFIPGVPGRLIVPDYTVWVRHPGDAYAIEACTAIVAEFVGSGYPIANTYDASPLQSTTLIGQVNIGPVVATGNIGFLSLAFLGSAVQIKATGGNPTPGTGNLIVTMYYRYWDPENP